MFIPHHTKNFGDIAARIKKLAAELDRDWFKRKKKEFEKLCKDGEDYYEIDTETDTQAVNFDLFCFSANYADGVTGKTIADKIITTTSEIINDAGDDKDYQAFKLWIDDVKVWIEEEVNDKINFYRNEEYTILMHGIVHKIKWEIDYYFNNKLKALEVKYERNKIAAPVKKVTVIRSFKWQGKLEDLPKLYTKIKGDLVSNESKLIDFKHTFLHKDLAMITPLKWHDNNASELLYFIMQLSEKGLIAGKRLNYQALKGCFLTNEGKKFTASFKNLKQSIPLKLTPAKMAKIDAIVKEFI